MTGWCRCVASVVAAVTIVVAMFVVGCSSCVVVDIVVVFVMGIIGS